MKAALHPGAEYPASDAEVDVGAAGALGQTSRISADASQTLRFRWSLLLSGVLLTVLAVPFLAGEVYVGDDLGAFHLPVREFYSRALADGDAFDWMPSLFTGCYLTGEGQAGTYHPVHWGLYRFLPLQAAFGLEILLSYPVMLLGMYFWLRRCLGRRDAAILGSMIFTFSSFNLLHLIHPNAIAIVAHIPWLLWAIDVAIVEQGRRRMIFVEAAIVLLTASQLLLGYPQYVWFSLLAEIAYVVLRLKSEAPARPVFLVSRLTLAKLLGLLIGAVQLLPTIDALGGSVRSSVSREFTQIGSLDPLNLVQLVAPYLFRTRVVGLNTHELGLYCGAVPLMLVTWMIVRRRDWGRLKPLAWATMICGAVALLLAMGGYTPIYRLQTMLPLVGGFRCPCRAIVLFQLCFAVAAAIGLMLLVRSRDDDQPTQRDVRWLWAVVGLSVLAALLVPVKYPQQIAEPGLVWFGPLAMVTAALLMMSALRGSRLAMMLLLAMTAADLGGYGLSYAATSRRSTVDQVVARQPTPPQPTTHRVLADAGAEEAIRYRIANGTSLAGIRRVHGYAGLPPRRQLDYGQHSALRAAGVDWVLRRPGTDKIAGLTRHDEHWSRSPDPLPRAHLVCQAQRSDHPRHDLAKIDLTTTALVDTAAEISGDRPGTAEITEDRPGRIEIHAVVDSPQLLVISEHFHAGWRADIAGTLRPVHRTNGDFLGVVVPVGEHKVTLRFMPESLRWGRIASLCGLGLLVAFLAFRLANHHNLPE
jgi:hypothetical protein